MLLTCRRQQYGLVALMAPMSLMICALLVTLGCAQQVPGTVSDKSEPGLLGLPENYVRRNAGRIEGRVHVATLQLDDASTGRALRSLRDWSRLMRTSADIEVVIDRAIQPSSLTTSAPLLVVPGEVTLQYARGDFWQRLRQYMASGGTVLFTHGEVPPELQAHGAARVIPRSHAILNTPFEINPGSNFRAQYVEVAGRAAAFDVGSLTALSPLMRVNVLAYVVGRHPGGVVELVDSESKSAPPKPPRAPRETPFD